MLTEQNRVDIIEDFQKNLHFKYMEFTPTVNIYRYGEGFEKKNPYILTEFLPAKRSRFKSISDVIGNATPNGQYKQYGYCQIELMSLYCYSGEFHDDNDLNGRLLTYALANTLLVYILRNLEQLLWKMYASFDRGEDINIKDNSYYDPNTASKIYCYSIDVYLRTQMRWDKIPNTFEEEEILEKISVFGKTTDQENYNLIKRIDVS